jgi:menaquinone-specific isochorismate synthase
MTTSAVSAPLVKSPLEAVEAMRLGLDSARAYGAPTMISVPAPVAPLEAFLEGAPEEPGFLWSPPEGPSFAGLGAVETFVGRGQPRGEQIRRQSDAVFGRLEHASFGDDAAPRARCFGGFSFQPGSAVDKPWVDFGDARFVLPRFRYATHGHRAWLSVTVRPEEATSENTRRILTTNASTLLGVLNTAAREAPPKSRPEPRRVLGRDETSEGEYRSLVQSIVDRIAQGEFAKVVISRRTRLSFAEPVNVSGVLRDLGETSEHCTRFAFRFGGVTFLGASPECLIRREGLSIATQALAGSSEGARAHELMQSPKEREEHELVVREIVRVLSPLCTALDYPAVPDVRVLRHLLHLTTPIRGRLARPVHVLDLVLGLHPTPAVGGVPAADAVRFITRHEHSERGWYASPVGWFDAEGDGEFAVGLRSGALVADEAYLYAGGGIVRDSDPASEYAETRLKLAALSAALHVAQ